LQNTEGLATKGGTVGDLGLPCPIQALPDSGPALAAPPVRAGPM